MIYVDAKGKECPIPVLMTKKEIENGADALVVEVDNKTAVGNLQRLATAMGFTAQDEENAGVFRLTLTKTGEAPDAAAVEAAVRQASAPTGDWVVFAGRDVVGSGERALGESLVKMFFFTLAESDDLPAQILLMNDGVKLAATNPATVEHLQTLASRGVDILVCGTCLNFYGIAAELKVGTVSNMYDILSRMQAAVKVIAL